MENNQTSELFNDRPIISQILSTLFFPAAALYYELLLRSFDYKYTPFFSVGLLREVLFSLAAGLLISLVLNLIPSKKASRITGGVLLAAGMVIFCIERGCRSMFGLYFGITTVGVMTGEALNGFASTVWAGFLKIIPFFILSLIPTAVFIIFRKVIISDQAHNKIIHISTAAAVVICHAAAVLMSLLGGAKNYYTYDFTANNAIPNFGLVTSMRMELEYAFIGVPQADLDNYIEEPPMPVKSETNPTAKPLESSNSEAAVSETNPETHPEPPKTYGFNILDIDFEALAENTSDETLRSMHKYFGSLTPSQQNEYTGLFAGKNLIFITAEAFSPYFISEELTPTLYRLTHEGFVFNNYYQPDWSQSTVGGEIANTTGIIPTWIDGRWASAVAAKDYMPFTLGYQFSLLGYNVPAWHNHLYNYYGRDKYLTAFGYDYKGGQGGGLVLPNGYSWPESDLEMMQATADSYIDDYVNKGKPFHAYYMTVSGHAGYTFVGNAMASKNRKAAQAAYPEASEAVQAYIACNLELEYAMEYLVDKLEEKGIADDTLIVLAADHYPYGLISDGFDYYNELRGFEDTELVTSRYRNALIMWSASIEEPIIVDTPCSSIDILPTLSNLFGLKYDSRLMIGRDILAQNYEPDQYSSCMPLVIFISNHGQGVSWITAAGVYEASTGIFTPNEGITVDDDYISRVKRLAEGKMNYSRLILSKNYYTTIYSGS